MRKHRSIAHIAGAVALIATFAAWDGGVPASASQLTLAWTAPLTASELRIGRKPAGGPGGPDRVDSGNVSKFCPGTVSLPEGIQLSCQILDADTTYEYFLCATDQTGENLGGFECSFHGNGGGWECTPTDIAAGWCDWTP